MKKLLIGLLTVLPLMAIHATENSSLLDTLDNVLSEKERYFEERNQRIHILERRIKECGSDEECFDLIGEIFNEYKSYNLDSAYFFVKKRLAIAVRSGNEDWLKEAQMNLAEVYSITGMYTEALEMLSKLRVRKERFSYYYHIYHATYLQLEEYSFSKAEQDKYTRLANKYVDSLLMVIPPGNIDYELVRSLKFKSEHKYEATLAITLPYLNNPSLAIHSRAMLAENISETYRLLNDHEKQTKYLIISAINDVKAGVREFVSLRRLATVLYKQGDVERAYHYIKYSMEASASSNSRFRMLQTAQSLPIIVDSYETALKKKQFRLYVSIIAISLMLVLVLIAVMYIRRQNVRLQHAHKSLDELNHQLQEVNDNLNDINKSLKESTHVKEEYIGYVFNMCSAYIDKLEDFRKRVNRKMREDKPQDVLKMTNATTLIDDELKEFLHSFDIVFLNIYPNFIEEFNQLLQADKRLHPKAGELLTPEMRIYALIRLGITDSTKIATFLHYSPQTVYNYRMKIRNSAIVSKDDFNQAIVNIGFIE